MDRKILVCGDRYWKDEFTIADTLLGIIGPGDTLIHGGAKGADTIAGNVVSRLGYSVTVFKAQWDKYGKGAGPVRNQQMIDQNPDLVIAFHSDLAESKGTADTVRRANKAGIKVWVIPGK